MSLATRKRSVRNFKLASQGIIWGGGLLGGCLLGLVVVVLPSATDSTEEVEQRALAAAQSVAGLPPADSTAVVPSATASHKIAGTPDVASNDVDSNDANDKVHKQAHLLLSASAAERRELARIARRRAIRMAAREREQRDVTEKKSRFPVPQKLGPAEATLAYWNQMNVIIAEEEQIRAVPTGGLNKFNAQNFLSRRVQSGEFASKALSKLDITGVDRDVISLSKALGEWYLTGSKVAQSGETLLVSGTEKSRRGEQGKKYKSWEIGHSQAVEQINRRGSELQQMLSKKYGLEFPPLK